MTYFVDSWPLFQVIFIIAQWADEQSEPMNRYGGYVWAQ